MPKSCIINEFALGKWVSAQRTHYKRKEISQRLIKRLNKVPRWVWRNSYPNWDDSYLLLRSMIHTEPLDSINETTVVDNLMIGEWIKIQKQDFSNNELSEKKIDLLEELDGWTWVELRNS